MIGFDDIQKLLRAQRYTLPMQGIIPKAPNSNPAPPTAQKECECQAWGALCSDCALETKQGPLSAIDVRSAKYDREPWSGKIFDETRLAIALATLRSIRDEQPGANSAVKALAEATLEVCE